jgi:hypothetical protein
VGAVIFLAASEVRSGGAVEIDGNTAGVERHGGEDEAGSWGPLDREMRGRWPAWKARTCHTPFQERGNEASIRVPRMFKSHV